MNDKQSNALSASPENTASADSIESLIGQVAEDFIAAAERGEHPDVDEFAKRHPRIASVLRQVLPALDVMRSSDAGGHLTGDCVDSNIGAIATPTSVLGDFHIVREIGRGGMGIVYEAQQCSLGRRVALKVLPFAGVMDERQLQRFKNEAAAAAQLHHTNIVPVFSVGCERGVHYYAMQFIDGQTLADVISILRQSQTKRRLPSNVACDNVRSAAQSGPEDHDRAAAKAGISAATTSVVNGLSTERSDRPREYFRTVARLGIQCAEAIDHAHQVGIVHRDIKPSNLLLDGRGDLWITDFGLARFYSPIANDEDHRRDLTLTGDLIGTLRYMSPEQTLAKRVVIDHRTDIYSLGVTLYELLTLRPAFSGSNRADVLRQIAFDDPPPPRKLTASIPVELETIVLKACAKNPLERYATAQELASDLRRHLDDKPILARRPTLWQQAKRWSRRHRAPVIAAAVIGVTTVIFGTSSWAWVAQERSNRRADLRRAALEAFQEAAVLGGQASAAPDDPTGFTEALSAVKRAEALMPVEEYETSIGRQIADLRAALQSSDQAARARQAQRQQDRNFVSKLEGVRSLRTAVHDEKMSWSDMDTEYSRLFRNYGLDLESLGMERAAEKIAANAIRAELAAAIDDWSLVCRAARGNADSKWKDLVFITRAADPDELRVQVRNWLLRGDDPSALPLNGATVPPATAVLLARALAASGSRDRAVAILQDAQREFPGDYWVNRDLAEQFHDLEARQWPDMVRYATAALSLRPDSADAHRLLGDALRHSGDLEGAMAEIRRALQLNPDHVGAHHILGVALHEYGDLDGAIAEFGRALELKPDSAGTHMAIGRVLKDRGHLMEAIAEFQRALDLKPNFAAAHDNLGSALEDSGDAEGAIAEYQRALDLKPTFAEVHHNLGCALLKRGDLDGAIVEFRKALDLKPDLAPAHINLGAALVNRGDRADLVDAITEFRRALQLDPGDALCHYNLGNALMKQGDLDAAITEYRQALELNPDPEAYYNLGNALMQQGDLDAAIAEFRHALDLNPDYARAHYNLGNALRDQGNVDAAMEELRRTLELNPDHAEAHTNLGRLLMLRGDVGTALAEFRLALTLKPDLAMAHNNLGRTLMERGDLDVALAELRRALELEPDNALARNNLRQCQRLLELDGKLDAITRGEARPKDALETVEFALLCQLYKHRNAAAVRLYEEAFAANPMLASDMNAQHRYNAACAAALAAAGEGVDAEFLEIVERNRLRQQALEWLRADLEYWKNQWDFASRCEDADRAAKLRTITQRTLKHWQQDPDLASVRDLDAVAKLPGEEREQWISLGAEVVALLEQGNSE